jgi:hypothetical protein
MANLMTRRKKIEEGKKKKREKNQMQNIGMEKNWWKVETRD